MLRTASTSLVFCLCLIAGQSASAHLLNMTRIEVDATKHGVFVALHIDLGQSLMSPEAYWRAANATPDDQERLLTDALNVLNREIKFFVDDALTPRTLLSVEATATSMEAIRNPLTPQMAVLRYGIASAQAKTLQVRLGPTLDIPWPCLLKVTASGLPLPQSRLLTEVDRSSRPVFLDAAGIGSQDRPDQAAWLTESLGRLAPGFAWVAVGFQHIIPKGLDHILFVLGLFLLHGGWRSLLVQVTAFTLAHTLTLGLAAYGLVRVPPSIVEPLIALSIVYVALENTRQSRLSPVRLAIIALFGLLHGLGFAGALFELGLPDEDFFQTLLLFNLGVEFGQLTVLLMAFLFVGWCAQRPWYAARLAQPATIAIAGTGVFWFLKRIAL